MRGRSAISVRVDTHQIWRLTLRMYGKQFSILATAADLQELDALLQRRSDVVLVDFDKATATSTPVPQHATPPAGALNRWIARAPSPLIVSGWRSEDRQVADVSQEESEVIEYWRPSHEGSVIRRGRLYFQRRNNDGSARDPELCRWADRVMASVKRTLLYDKGLMTYLGLEAQRQIAGGHVTVGY